MTIRGAGGNRSNIQVGVVLRPEGSGPFPLVVWFHGGDGLHLADVQTAAPLAAKGLMVLIGCWQYTPSEPTIYLGVSYPTIACLNNHATPADAVSALVTVGEQLPGVRKGTIGIFGVSSSTEPALHFMQGRSDVGAVVVDAGYVMCPCVDKPAAQTVHILFLGGTLDGNMSLAAQQQSEQVLRAHGYSVDDHYYPGAGHAITYFGTVKEDAIHRTVQFFIQHLDGPST